MDKLDAIERRSKQCLYMRIIPGIKEINRKCRTIFCTNIFGSIIRIYALYIRALYVRINMRRDIRSVRRIKIFLIDIMYIFIFFIMDP